MRDLYWKNDIDDLRGQAAAVMAQSDDQSVSARQAAAILSGVCGLVARRTSVDEMQRTCAQLARMAPLCFGRLPTDHTGRVTEAMALVAATARAILPLAGESNLKAALAFWASEDDPAVWNQIAA